MSAVLILFGCIDDQEPSSIEKTGENMVRFSIQVSGLRPVRTRTLVESDENKVTDVEILLFNTTNGQLALDPVYVNSVQDDPNDVGTKTFSVKIPAGTYNVVMLANTHNELTAITGAGAISVGDSKEDVLATLIVEKNSKWGNDPSSSDYRSIPMWGELSSLTVGPNTPTNNPVTLIRMLAKIDVVLTNATTIANFKLKSVRLYNAKDEGCIVPQTGNWDHTHSLATAPSIPSTASSISTPLVYEDTEITTTDVSCTNQIYTFENAKKTSSSIQPGDPCLVIGGVFNGDAAETFYKVEFAQTSANTTTYLDLLRNHHYRVNIIEVSGRGYSTAAEAFSSKALNIKTEITERDATKIKDFTFNGQYMMGVSQKEFSFEVDPVDQNNLDNMLSVTTDYPGGWTVDKIVDNANNPVTWLTTTATNGQANIDTDIQLTMPQNTELLPRVANIHLKAGRMTYIVKISQWGRVAKGNLVADGLHGAKIGSPEDGGLYFHWASLVGWNGGATGDGTGRPSVSTSPIVTVFPAGYTGSTVFGSLAGGNINVDNPLAGTGDPCRYYLHGTWRLPTHTEFTSIFTGYPNGSWDAVGSFVAGSTDSYAVHISGLKFPAVGYRFYTYGGVLSDFGIVGDYWINYGGSQRLLFTVSAVTPLASNTRPNAFTVRCVRD